ncbi:beta-lactamase family protein [Mucilaginibacter daejeonensis]|uniref:serine hydrolase domain-containing protein n=1 Tax=Mucilaginibacter daejeonensis TaxID=398049 RepID=UPI001D17CE9C|nr:serine hydrolase domain-containing protein [Mucilaginibacter daejeonensis]UEG53793.1 beta-lactamase family protein [Mucilaginibacter daejeonensis]
MLRKFTFIVLAAASLQTANSFGQTFNKAKADSLFDAVAKNDRAMMSVTVTRNGQVLYSRAIGYAWYGDQKIPATTKTKYRIGSISKVFTAAMIFQLIQEGKLKLTTPLSDLYPQIPNAAKITIAHMLDHSSGIHSFTSDADYKTWLNKPATPAQLIAKMTGASEFEPGSKHEYSNSNFVLLGYIIEKLDKRPYAKSLEARITKKLNLKDTYYGGKIRASANEAYSYTWADNTWKPSTETDMSIPGGAGALVSTPTDLTTFMNALFNGKVVSAENLKLMRTIKDGYGMNLFSFKFDDHTAYGHTGGIDGFQSQATYFPEDGIALAEVSNGVNGNINNIMIGLLSIVFNKPYQIPTFKTLTLKTEELDKYLGNYSSTQIPLKIAVTKDGSTLKAQATGQAAFALEAMGDHQFKFEPAGIVMVFDPATSQMTLKQGGRTFAYTKDK